MVPKVGELMISMRKKQLRSRFIFVGCKEHNSTCSSMNTLNFDLKRDLRPYLLSIPEFVTHNVRICTYVHHATSPTYAKPV